MKIQKIKSQGIFVYPATIAAAVKDANFRKQDNSPMTQGEINLYLNSKTGSSGNEINDNSISATNTWSSQKISEELKKIPVDEINENRFEIYDKEILIQDKENNSEVSLNGDQITVTDNSSNDTTTVNAANILFSKNDNGNEVSSQIGFDNNSNNVTFILTDASGKKSYYALKAVDLNNNESTPAYIATEAQVNSKQDKLVAGTDIKIENNVISVEEDWNLAVFDTNAFNSGSLTVTAPNGYIFDSLYILCHWYGNAAAAASTIYGGFYQGKNTDAEKQVLRNNGTNKMGAGYITANIINMDNTSAIAYGEAYLFNNNGSAASLNNPINSYGIGRYSHTNNFKYFTIHNYPANVTEGYCCIKYKLKKQ